MTLLRDETGRTTIRLAPNLPSTSICAANVNWRTAISISDFGKSEFTYISHPGTKDDSTILDGPVHIPPEDTSANLGFQMINDQKEKEREQTDDSRCRDQWTQSLQWAQAQEQEVQSTAELVLQEERNNVR